MSEPSGREIEAVARFYYRWMMGDDYPEFPWDDDNTPSNETKREAERFAAEFHLDRVRDARSFNDLWQATEGMKEQARLDAECFIAALGRAEIEAALDLLRELTAAHGQESALAVIEEALDRVRDARGDDEAVVWRSMLDRIRIHGASGLWTGEDCAIGAVAALEGGDAGRAFMLERESARSPQGEREVEAVERALYDAPLGDLKAAAANAIAALDRVRDARGDEPLTNDYDAQAGVMSMPSDETVRSPQGEDHEEKP